MGKHRYALFIALFKTLIIALFAANLSTGFNQQSPFCARSPAGGYSPETSVEAYSLTAPPQNHGCSPLSVPCRQPTLKASDYRSPRHPPHHGAGSLNPPPLDFKEDDSNDSLRSRGFSLNSQQLNIKSSIRNQNDVGVTLAKQIMAEKMKYNANCVFSPLSINTVLSIIAAGATGSTKDQLLSFLNSSSIEELHSLASEFVTNVLVDGSSVGGPRLSFVNGAWIDKSLSFKPDFKDVADNVYKARSTQVDFKNKANEARIEVNNWAENVTNGLIKDLIPDGVIDESTNLILANALYFKGVWDQKFNESMTREHYFHLLNGGTIKAPLMTSREDQYIGVYEGFKVLRLPYQQGRDKARRFSLYVYLPDDNNGLQYLVEEISRQPGFIESHLPQRQVPVGNFFIPKFEISNEMEASDILKQLGLVLPFEEKGLTDMVNSELRVSKILHKSFFEVNESGAEAAAATAAFMVGDSLDPKEPEPVVDFVADHPFLFLIREDRKGTVLFMGSVVNPVSH